MIKFLDLKALNERFSDEINVAFQNFLNSGRYILGEGVKNFEEDFSQYCGIQCCIGVSNGLDALKLIIEGYKVLGQLCEGDEIIVPANTYIATILAISNSGFKPILVEPNLKTYNIDTDIIKSYITTKTKAIIGVHLYGRLFNSDRLNAICQEYGLILIEDAAQAHGAQFRDGKRAGNLSDAAAFSFYPTKNLGALGDAGAVTTNNLELAEIIKMLRDYGRDSTNVNEIKGFNCRLDEFQALILSIKLKHLDSDNSFRRNLADVYSDLITLNDLRLPDIMNKEEHVYHQYVIRHKKRDKLRSYLLENGIETLVHYPKPAHKQLAYKEWNTMRLPITEQIHNEVLSLPINPIVTKNEVEIISKLINAFK